jgi:CxxC motif-containing protein (DUF1111 family)
MKFLYKAYFALAGILILFLTACSEKPGEDILTPSGKVADPAVLSADDLTIFSSSSKAYDTPNDYMTGYWLDRFLAGDKLYDMPRVANPTESGAGGLGPLYVGFSCTSCHDNAGRSVSTLFTAGGSGNGFSSQLVFIKSRNGQLFRNYGRVLHDQAIFGITPEGKIHVSYNEVTYKFPTEDGEQYKLIFPTYWITDWYADAIPDDNLIISVRTPLRHVGLGPMMAVDQNEIKELAAKQYPGSGVSGKINWVTERGQTLMGLSGHKAQHADLTVELGFYSDMGVTNDRYPEEVGEGQSQNTTDFGIEISTKDMANVELYMYNLGIPARRNIDDPIVKLGEKKFYEALCHQCHTPTLHTGPEVVQLMDGTRMPHLSNKVIHPYTDYLIHDMGEILSDNYSQFNASGREWRTAPLWGIGLQETVNGHSNFLHDGRARNLLEAIMWHSGGEAKVSYEIFRHMPKSDRDAIIKFLMSL